MRTRLIAEVLVAADASGRMRGLADYRSGYSTHNLVECAFDIDVRRWHTRGLFRPQANFLSHWLNGEDEPVSLRVRVESDFRVWLTYRVRLPNKRNWQQIKKMVSMIWDPCRFGGERPWFVCPNCDRRAAVLYLGGVRPLSFSCRKCAGLKYESECKGTRLRLMRKAQKIRLKLGGSSSLEEPFPEKPPGMHAKRYLRIREEAMNAEREWHRLSEYVSRWIGDKMESYKHLTG
jgi:hypothetical protein